MNAPDKTVEVSQAARELERCPFCGATHIRLINGGPGNSFVMCASCGAQTDDGPEDLVIRRWNTRATQPEAALREALEDGALERLEMHFRRLAQIARGTLECNTDDVRKLEETATYINQYRKEQR